ncbi:glutaredoxin 3 [Candidatus Blochmannia sp. SNP]|uniref:glutaredoxin 3 n=1 Tax=Candidatus Blochmannia sp. SNP TaxID=3118169 RepID=UPI002F93C0B2
MAYIEIYTKINCPYCDRAKKLLIKKSLDFKEIPIDHNNSSNSMYIEMQQRSNGCTTVPQIFINGLHIGGSDDLISLDNEGQLNLILTKK